MNWHANQLKYAMGLGGIMSFYGIVAMIVWVGGTQFGWQLRSRFVVIALVLITMPFALIIGFVASRRKKKKEAKEKEKAEEKVEGKAEAKDEKTDDDKSPQKLAKPTGNYEDIDKSSQEVVQFLKDSNLGTGGKESVYSLPWYVVAGTPKSGKSSLVMGSNLDFQNLPSQRQSELKFVRPTRNIDWRVTSDAVFIDTAGRYQGEGVDQDEWAYLLEAIKKQRSDRPIDGFLLVINAEQILEAPESEVEQMAKVLRTRLDEAAERTKIHFPVYLIFTHADSIEGFKDSFSTSKQEDKSLVWGSTIPLEKSENGHALFDSEYGLLQDAVMKRRLMRLSAPFPAVKQLRIFNFPLHFGSARRRIGAFVSTLFRPNPFSKNPFLRGFYFTASPPIKTNARGNQTAETVGTTYFTERFFRDVILRDKDLLKNFQLKTKSPPILGWILTFLLTAVTLFLLVMSGISLYNNNVLLDEAVKRGQPVLEINKSDGKNTNPLDKSPELVGDEINKIEDLRELLTTLDDYERNGAPLYMRFGLYSGDRIFKENLLRTYFIVVENRFKNPTIKKLEVELQSFAQSNPVANPAEPTDKEIENLDKHYNLLMAYLMLTEKYKDKVDPAHLEKTLEDYWVNESNIPDGSRSNAKKQLTFWASQADRENFPPVNLDEDLVQNTQAKLKSLPKANRAYKQFVTEINDELKTGVTVQSILNANSGTSGYLEGTYTIPPAYTKVGSKLLNNKLKDSSTKLNEPDWVLGETEKTAVAETDDVQKIEEDIKKLYLRDYATQWTDFVRDIKIKPFDKNDLPFAQKALKAFSSPSSPIKIIAEEVANNTKFSEDAVVSDRAWYNPVGWWEKLMSLFEDKESLETDGEQPVETEFLPLHIFVAKEGDKEKKSQLDTYQAYIGDVENAFKDFNQTKIAEIAMEISNNQNTKFTELKDSSDAIGDLLEGFKTPAGKALAGLFMKPLDNLKVLFGDEPRIQIKKIWAENVLPEAESIGKGYPFEDGATEADINNLTKFLKPKDGTLAIFYDSYLQAHFDETAGGLKKKADSNVEFSEEFITYLNNAFRLREALFSGGGKPKFEYQFILETAEGGLVEITIDGTEIKSNKTASANLTFPSSGETGVIMKFETTDGGSTPSATPAPSANPSNSNVSKPLAFLQDTDSSGCSAGSNPIRCPGTWGLFRFFDIGSPEKEGNAYNLTYKFNGKNVKAKIIPSGNDLFDKQIFRSLKAPKTAVNN